MKSDIKLNLTTKGTIQETTTNRPKNKETSRINDYLSKISNKLSLCYLVNFK